MKKIVISIMVIFLILILSSILPVYGANRTFTLTVNPTTKTAKLGDTISIDLGIADIDQSTDGISALEGKIKFDSDLIENIDITTSNNWSVEINKTDDTSAQGKFIIARMGRVKETQNIGKIYAKIRDDATVKTGTITLQDVFSSYSDGATEKTTKTITVNIAEEGGQEENPSTPDTPDTPITPDTPTTPDTPANPSSQETPSKTTPTKTNSKETTSTSKATTLPKAGIIASGIGIAIIAAIIVAIIELVKYKRTGK